MYLTRLIEKWTDFLALVGALLVLPLVGAMVYEVLSRYLFGAPTFWAFELAYMMMGTIFMFGIAYAMKHRSHVNVDLISGSLGPRANGIITLLGFTLLVPCVAWLCYALFWYMVDAYQAGENSGKSAWNPVIWPYRLMYVIGFISFLLQIAAESEKAIHSIIHNTDASELA